MFKDTKAFSGFAVDDLEAAKKFYSETLGIEVEQGSQGLRLKVAGGNPTFVYSKPDHVPATYTILNFPVADIDRAVDQLTAAGVKFEHYGNGHSLVQGPGRQHPLRPATELTLVRNPLSPQGRGLGRGALSTTSLPWR